MTRIAPQGRYGRTTLFLAGLQRLDHDDPRHRTRFFPARQITSLWSIRIRMFGGTLFFIGLAAFFFFVYGRRKA